MLIQINETVWCRTCNVVKVEAKERHAVAVVATRDSEEFHCLGEMWDGAPADKAKDFAAALNELDHP